MGLSKMSLAELGEKIRELFSGHACPGAEHGLEPPASLALPPYCPGRSDVESAGNEAFPDAPENRSRTGGSDGWYTFLAEEARRPEGLLCFYDRPRSPRVNHCSLDFAAAGAHYRN